MGAPPTDYSEGPRYRVVQPLGHWWCCLGCKKIALVNEQREYEQNRYCLTLAACFWGFLHSDQKIGPCGPQMFCTPSVHWSCSAMHGNEGKIQNLPHQLVPLVPQYQRMGIPMLAYWCLPLRANILDLAERLENSGSHWGAARVVEKWTSVQPWRFLTWSKNAL